MPASEPARRTVIAAIPVAVVLGAAGRFFTSYEAAVVAYRPRTGWPTRRTTRLKQATRAHARQA